VARAGAVIGLDTNVLLRALISEDVWPDDQPGQMKAARRLITEGNESFFVNHVVLAETVWVLSGPMRQPKSKVVEVLDGLLAATNVVVDRHEAVAAAVAAFRDGKPGFADHLIGHVNRMSGCDHTVSFDKDARSSPTFRLLSTSA
jgi:predicted nucleic-acid-binding protein